MNHTRTAATVSESRRAVDLTVLRSRIPRDVFFFFLSTHYNLFDIRNVPPSPLQKLQKFRFAPHPSWFVAFVAVGRVSCVLPTSIDT